MRVRPGQSTLQREDEATLLVIDPEEPLQVA
jgi:hypothetical protein